MDLRGIFKKNPVTAPGKDGAGENRPEVPEGLLKKCNKCGKAIYTEEYKKNMYICPKCGGYLRMPAEQRIRSLVDIQEEELCFTEWDTDIPERNPLRMKGYPDRIRLLKEKTGLDEAVVTGLAQIGGHKVVLMVMDCRFLTASMGEVTGEKIARGVERATKDGRPVVIFCCSGGARMQEGMTSLMQMAKTAAALKRHSDAGLLSISVLTDPTTGGVTASFAMLGDIILAEPGALIGFAGPRVIEQTIGQRLPKGFQRSEFLLDHGFIDRIVERADMRAAIGHILDLHSAAAEARSGEISVPGEVLETLAARAKSRTPWERVKLSREKNRPVGEDYIERLFDGFMEFHGDRAYGDDPAICGGAAFFHGRPVTVIAQMKGKNTKGNVKRNFGMPMPEGYRKALRLMKQAEKFHRPVISFVDTPGAFCGTEAEERGQGEAIARNLFEMSALRTPILSILIGEGGSGGALAGAVADEVWILENAMYSILSPEGFASILWKDASLAERAAKVMKLTSYDLYRAGFVEAVLPEPEDYTADNMAGLCADLDRRISGFLLKKGKETTEQLLEERYERFRRM